ncbi:MAG: exodeoxyribonuclease VII small subunit [Pseudomonadota bacterium]|nr:exodeoxyribonuclease VII small subunit [Pseudomonadota bacterium]
MEKEKNSPPADIGKLSFEDALLELEKLVRQLEDGKAKLDDAITAYERGAWLKAHCETKLREAQTRIEKITLGADGKVSVSPLNT